MEGQGNDPTQWGAPPPGGGAPPPPPPYAPPPGYGYPGQAPPQPGWGGQPYYAPAGPKTSGQAIAALILGIASFVVCPIVPAIIALILASSAKREIRASGGALEGESLATAGKVLAIINLALGVLGLAFFVIILIVAAASNNSSTSMGALLLVLH